MSAALTRIVALFRPGMPMVAMVAMMTMLPMLLAVPMASGASAGPTLVVHYSERTPLHYTDPQGRLAGDAATALTEALAGAGIAYQVRRTPAKRQLVLLDENREPACMMSWVEMPGRERRGKFSAVIYRDERPSAAPAKGGERRLWCTRMVADDVIERLNAALARQRN